MDDALLRWMMTDRLGGLTGWEPPEWMGRAACGGMDPDLFFPARGKRAPVEVCADCPVRGDCLDYALTLEDEEAGARHGVFGGLTPQARAKVANGDPVPAPRERPHVRPDGVRVCRNCHEPPGARGFAHGRCGACATYLASKGEERPPRLWEPERVDTAA